MATLDVNFNLDEGGHDLGMLGGLLNCKPDDHLADDVLKFFDNAADIHGPTSSSSDGSGSSRGTPHSSLYQQSVQSVSRDSASGASWVQMAPQLAGLQNSAPTSATVLYSVNPQPHWGPAVWHPAFPTDSTAQQSSKESKNTISHSTIEKQRRDRINSLIDELRELVPPSAASVRGPDGGDIKRPKHVVLSDTIALLQHLKAKVQQDEVERQRLQLLQRHLTGSELTPEHTPHAAFAAGPQMLPVTLGMPQPMDGTMAATSVGASAQFLLQHSLSGSVSAQTVAAAATAAMGGTNSSCPELPQAPSHLPSAVGVLVEAAPGSFLVKVNCKDRHGLLSDITQALGSMPLQITRAAITTSNGGAVYDVFEIIVEPSSIQEPVTALDVQYHVHQALHKWKSANSATAATADVAAAQTAGKRLRV